jgi:hypothetical protein
VYADFGVEENMTARLIDLQSVRGFRPIVVRPEPEEDVLHRLTTRDRIAVAVWGERSERHGYRRVLVVSGERSVRPEDADYALVYAGDEPWARWGLSRCVGGIAVWHCASGEDMGVYATMAEALESLPAIVAETFHGKLLDRR